MAIDHFRYAFELQDDDEKFSSLKMLCLLPTVSYRARLDPMA